MKNLFYLIILLFVILTKNIPVAYSQSSLEERLKQHVYVLASDSLMGRKAGSEYAKKAANYIAKQWQEIGITPLVGDYYFKSFRQDQYRNIVGIIEGNDPILKHEYIIVGAHYDHLGSRTNQAGKVKIFNGADDNASGVAAIIELGRNLKAKQTDLSRSVILIAFDAEELGLYGSNEFAKNPPVPIEKIKLMFSVDMVGWYGTSGVLKYMGTKTFKDGNNLLLNPDLIPEGLNVKTKNFETSVISGTDTYGFARKGIPTLAVTTGLKSPYHKPEDEAHLIDYEGMALVTEHLTNIIFSVSQDDTFKASGKIASKHEADKRFMFGISANFGSNYHKYTEGALDGKTAFAFGAGLSGQVNINFLAIRPEVFYENIKARYPENDINIQSITVPLNFVLQTSYSNEGDDFGAGKLAVFIGPYYSYKFDGKQGKQQLDFKNIFNREEMGINWGFEIQVTKLRLGFTSRNALTNFTQTKNTDNAHIRNNASYFTMGYVF